MAAGVSDWTAAGSESPPPLIAIGASSTTMVLESLPAVSWPLTVSVSVPPLTIAMV